MEGIEKHGPDGYSIIEESRNLIPGTKCGNDTFDMCLDGECIPAGCDHVLYSDAKVDVCGVCNGDNSTCKQVNEFFV